LSGNVAADGQANVTIDLTSVNTGIELRDERMREMLFDTANFATAQVSVKVDPEAIAVMSPGDASEMAVTANLNLHGETREVPATVIVARSGEARLLVVSKEPVIVNASQFRLVEGVQALQEIAGLPSISLAVPVTFVLTFDMQ
jgi:polyisoprenoid-binding protein YceI